jgi:putative NIF3 family GTP cyclohydrolase 1 type 2
MMKAALSKGCDTLITGDVKYHEAQTALQMNLTLIDAGHFETEQIYVEKLAEKLEHAFALKSYEVAVLQSEAETTPFHGV